MLEILNKLNIPELRSLLWKVDERFQPHLIQKYYKMVCNKYTGYDTDFLYFVFYKNSYTVNVLKYIDIGYEKYKKILDSGFLKKLISRRNFESHVWEIILCDVLSHYGTFIPKKEKGADILLKDSKGQIIQIEAIVPNEADNKDLRAVKADFTESNYFQYAGNIAELEMPIILRFFQGFGDKVDGYDKSKPLIIAINTGVAVGVSTLDEYVLRMALFGLGCNTITKHSDGSFSSGFVQSPTLDKGNGRPFKIGRFRDPLYSHISGVIYSSQKPTSLTSNGYGWSNSGLVFIPNPLATHPVDIDFECMSKMIVNDDIYSFTQPSSIFKSSISLD
jgi:hypothetical protein